MPSPPPLFQLLLREFHHRARFIPSAQADFARRGLTLIELIIVIAIIGVLAALAFPYGKKHIERANTASAISQLKDISREIEAFHLDNGRYPDSLDEIRLGGFTDPWGNPVRYLNIETVKGKGKLRKDRNLVPVNSDYDLYSMGPDGDSSLPFTAKKSRDDIVRANNGGFYGVAANY